MKMIFKIMKKKLKMTKITKIFMQKVTNKNNQMKNKKIFGVFLNQVDGRNRWDLMLALIA